MAYQKKIFNQISKIDAQEFEQHLSEETALLEEWFIKQEFMERELAIGAEIEFFLLDKHYAPLPKNLTFIDLVNQPFLKQEVGAAQLEINSLHFSLYDDCFSSFHNNILNYWQQCLQVAQNHNYHIALIGTLPTAPSEYNSPKFMTNKSRYQTLTSIMKSFCKGKLPKLHIEGQDILSIIPKSLAINGLLSAYQLHIQVGQSQSVQYYNIAQAIAAPILAISANSPFIFAKQLWSETRIPLFEQSMAVHLFGQEGGFNSCLFGINYLRDSFFELFDQNYHFFPRLMPEVSFNLPPEKMMHVKRQNGVVYRWNRPVIDFNPDLKPHLRIEHRGPPSGPTIIDMVANAAFFYGLLYYFATQTVPIDHLLPFYDARRNFLNAARFGLKAKFKWFANHEISALKLLEELLPLSHKGLEALGVSSADNNFYLEIIKQRVKAKTNGSEWQIRFIEKYGNDFYNMMSCYLENQYQDCPISEWKL